MDFAQINQKILELWDTIQSSKEVIFEDVKIKLSDKDRKSKKLITHDDDLTTSKITNIEQFDQVLKEIADKPPYLYGGNYENCDVLFVGCNYSDTWKNNIVKFISELNKLRESSSTEKIKKGRLKKLRDEKYKSIIDLFDNVEEHDTETDAKNLLTATQDLINALEWNRDYTNNADLRDELVKRHKKMMYVILNYFPRVSHRNGDQSDDLISTYKHIDMFFMRYTKEADLKPLLVIDNKLSDFATKQYKIFEDAIRLIKPLVVVAIDTLVSDILSIKIKEIDKIQPYYENCKIGEHPCSIILGGMLYGQRAMDRWSQARLKSTIDEVLKKKHGDQ